MQKESQKLTNNENRHEMGIRKMFQNTENLYKKIKKLCIKSLQKYKNTQGAFQAGNFNSMSSAKVNKYP